MYLENYVPIVLFGCIALIIASVPILLGYCLGNKKPNQAKLASYECGFSPFDDARIQFDVKFYLLAILFIFFDIEIAFLLPFAVACNKFTAVPFLAILMFIVLLGVGFIYEWLKGALEW